MPQATTYTSGKEDAWLNGLPDEVDKTELWRILDKVAQAAYEDGVASVEADDDD